MSIRTLTLGLFAVVLSAATVLCAAATSPQQADAFARKLDLIEQHATGHPTAPLKTPVSESEVNSWFAYRAQPLLPAGVSSPSLTIVGNGKVTGTVTVDLQQAAKARASNGTAASPLTFLGGKVPITVTGVLRTQNGQGQFDLQSADVSGLPVPKPLLQQLVSYYSRTPEHPDGVRLDQPFALPANIREIQIGQGQAVVVQ
jgi:hypothetical protein